MTIKLLFRILILFSTVLLNSKGKATAQEKPDTMPSPNQAEHFNINQFNPSGWFEQTENSLILIESKLLEGYDSSFMNEDYDRVISTFELIQKDFNSRGEFMRKRSLEDIKAEMIQLRNQVDNWRKKVARINTEISAEFNALLKIKRDSIHLYISQDRSLWEIYDDMFIQQRDLIAKIDSQCHLTLSKFVGIEKKLNLLTYNISFEISAIDKRIKFLQTSFFKKTHPAVWELNSQFYSKNIGTVLIETGKQNLESLKLYGKQAYIRAIIFRLFVLVITMLPILYFKRQGKKAGYDPNKTNYSLLHKYTGSAAASFGMVMAPFIFINAPHIIIEAILIMLSITTSHIFLAENPGINKKVFYSILVSFIILRFFNLMVSVTVFGRILWALSIFVCIPLYNLFFQIDRTTLRNKLLNKIIIALSILMIISGWILNITGHFPYGRILVISGLDGFFLAIVLFVAIYAFIDFIKITADLYNSRNYISQIRVDLIYQKLVNIVTFLAVIYWFVAFLQNVNTYEFFKNRISELFSQTTIIAGYPINFGSILIFIMILYFSIYLSGLLNGLFYDEKRSEESENKNNLGSYMLLLRLFVLTTGFIIAMIVAGIDLSKVNLIIGAFGVGIGFGLQNIISNVVSGLILAFERPIYVGDIIEIDSVKGKVSDIGLRATTIDTMEGAEFIVPNGELINKKMKNWTLTSKNFKIEIQIPVGIENDALNVINILYNAIEKTSDLQLTPTAKVTLTEIKPNALDFTVSCWVSDISKSIFIRNELLKNIHLDLQASGISFPQKL
jgi:small-conductance mechanosensitive channel